jgi:UDP-N-acetylmuramoylalanine--D-glutamate ligase
VNNEQNSMTLVVGLGLTGLSVARYLGAKGEHFSVVDSRENPPGKAELFSEFPDVQTAFGEFPEALFQQAKCLVVSPGIAVKTPIIQKAKASGAEIIGDIELFVREAVAPVIAITGSNGKSSVTTLVAEMIQQAGLTAYAGGNLGMTALDLLKQPQPDAYVMELSSFQLETTYSLQAAASVILNVCEDHMDRYDAYENYVAAKRVIYQDTGLAVINRDDEMAAKLPPGFKGDVISFGKGMPAAGQYGLAEIDDRVWLMKGEKPLLATDEMKLPGQHNALNALAAMALVEPLNLPMAAMLEAIKAFTGLDHRTQWVAEKKGVTWFNDSKGTNVGATIAALSGLPGKTVLIAGGQGKGADFSPLSEHLLNKARAVVVIGEDAELIKAIVPAGVTTVDAESMQDAVVKASEQAQQGDNVLLSPACASFDMFKSYGHRGDVFTDAVLNLLEEGGEYV